MPVVVYISPLEIMPRSVSSPAIAGLEFLTGLNKRLKVTIEDGDRMNLL